MADDPINLLIRRIAAIPGLGPRSARRAALYLLTHRDHALAPLQDSLNDVAQNIVSCKQCGNLAASDPCPICTDHKRDTTCLCVVERVADLWALERAHAHFGRYHVLGGRLSAMDGIGPDDLPIKALIDRVKKENMKEIILALNATVESQATGHYLCEQLARQGIKTSMLAHGLPLGGELDYMDEGTIIAAFRARASPPS
ncbi:MAG: recombination mediator RecR [Pseudomonadota bacterium]